MSSGSLTAWGIVSMFWTQIPALLIYVTAVALAGSRWRRQPRSAAFAVAGAVTLFVATVGSDVAWVMLVRSGSMFGSSPYFAIYSVASSAIHAAGLALLVTAIFVGRSDSALLIRGFPVTQAGEFRVV